ncbi:MAG: leucine-rich repeat domain-containing protein [Clostridia bacterium]|nr:leucine-rich repeat domain-containing protein [Clostridia bacterium]
MNSLEIIKQELIHQKALLEQKGFPVPISNVNPSPTEITTAINNINLDFTSTTATEEDVRAGKTFFSQNNEIKTGTFDLSEIDNIANNFNNLISGQSMEIVIPSNIDKIRNFAYGRTATDDGSDFYKENLVIPESVKVIGERSFCYANITGPLTIPETVEEINTYSFGYTNITEVTILCPVQSSATYAFTNSTKLKKATLGDKVTSLPSYFFRDCSQLNEIVLSPNMESFNNYSIQRCLNIEIFKFRGTTPCSIIASTFDGNGTAIILVPYLSFDAYYNATNYHAYGNPMYGYGEFTEGDNLPTSVEDYTVVWYTSLDDLTAGTNPVTSCSQTGTYYGIFTSTTEEETTE